MRYFLIVLKINSPNRQQNKNLESNGHLSVKKNRLLTQPGSMAADLQPKKFLVFEAVVEPKAA